MGEIERRAKDYVARCEAERMAPQQPDQLNKSSSGDQDTAAKAKRSRGRQVAEAPATERTEARQGRLSIFV